MSSAPFYEDLAQGPPGGETAWIKTSDGVRIRGGHWPGGTAGTLFIFNGRTEFIEKYGRTAREVVARDHHLVTLDWRGQGLADRLLDEPNIGHVGHFSDYQHDVRAILDWARARGVPEPYYVLGHSMGGAIALRTLIGEHPFAAAVFSGPMWGIELNPVLRILARALPKIAGWFGQAHRFAPGASPASYMMKTEFEGNLLTKDRESWDNLVAQVTAVEGFRLGGPSLNWLGDAMRETRELVAAPKPDLPVHTTVGSDERIVSIPAIRDVMANWPSGTLSVVPGAEHEILQEIPDVRQAYLDRCFETFAASQTT